MRKLLVWMGCLGLLGITGCSKTPDAVVTVPDSEFDRNMAAKADAMERETKNQTDAMADDMIYNVIPEDIANSDNAINDAAR